MLLAASESANERIRQRLGGGVGNMIKGGPNLRATVMLHDESGCQQVADFTRLAMVPGSLAIAEGTTDAQSAVQTARGTGS